MHVSATLTADVLKGKRSMAKIKGGMWGYFEKQEESLELFWPSYVSSQTNQD